MPDEATAVLDFKDLRTVFQTRQGNIQGINAVHFDLG